MVLCLTIGSTLKPHTHPHYTHIGTTPPHTYTTLAPHHPTPTPTPHHPTPTPLYTMPRAIRNSVCRGHCPPSRPYPSCRHSACLKRLANHLFDLTLDEPDQPLFTDDSSTTDVDTDSEFRGIFIDLTLDDPVTPPAPTLSPIDLVLDDDNSTGRTFMHYDSGSEYAASEMEVDYDSRSEYTPSINATEYCSSEGASSVSGTEYDSDASENADEQEEFRDEDFDEFFRRRFYEHFGDGYSSYRPSSTQSDAEAGPEPHIVLGVSIDASSEEIDRAWRRKSLHVHPDRNTSVDATAKMTQLNQARDTMKNML